MTREEYRKMCETMESILLPLIPHLKDDEAEHVENALRLLREARWEE